MSIHNKLRRPSIAPPSVLLAVLLSACGTPDSSLLERTVTPVGPEGANAQSADGLLTLSFPQGALSATVDVTIQTRRDVSHPDLLALAYDVDIDGMTLAAPAQIRLRLPEAVPAQQPTVVRVEGDTLVPAPGSTYDPMERVVQASVRQFSMWSAASGPVGPDLGVDAGPTDAGPTDAGTVDVGPPDLGMPDGGGMIAMDSGVGPADTGSMTDGGVLDSGAPVATEIGPLGGSTSDIRLLGVAGGRMFVATSPHFNEGATVVYSSTTAGRSYDRSFIFPPSDPYRWPTEVATLGNQILMATGSWPPGRPVTRGSTGLYVSTDGGQTFSSLCASHPQNATCEPVLALASTGQAALVAVGSQLGTTINSELYRTTDGVNFTRIPVDGVVCLEALSTGTFLAEVGTFFAEALMRSDNGGLTFAPAAAVGRVSFSSLNCDAFEHDGAVLKAGGRDLYQSVDDGRTWSVAVEAAFFERLRTPFLLNGTLHALSANQFAEIHRVDLVTQSTTPLGERYDRNAEMVTVQGEAMKVDNEGILRRSGSSWAYAAPTPMSSPRLHRHGGRLLALSPAGPSHMHRTTNGAVWELLNLPPISTFSSTGDLISVGTELLFFRPDAGLLVSTNLGTSWTTRNANPPELIRFDPSVVTSEGLLVGGWLRTNLGTGPTRRGAIFLTTDAGRTFNEISRGLPVRPSQTSTTGEPAEAYQLLALQNGRALATVGSTTTDVNRPSGPVSVYYRDVGGQWIRSQVPALGPMPFNTRLQAMADANHAYVVVDTKIYRSDDNGATFAREVFRGLLPAASGNLVRNAIADGSEIYVLAKLVGSSSVFVSTNGGMTYRELSQFRRLGTVGGSNSLAFDQNYLYVSSFFNGIIRGRRP